MSDNSPLGDPNVKSGQEIVEVPPEQKTRSDVTSTDEKGTAKDSMGTKNELDKGTSVQRSAEQPKNMPSKCPGASETVGEVTPPDSTVKASPNGINQPEEVEMDTTGVANDATAPTETQDSRAIEEGTAGTDTELSVNRVAPITTSPPVAGDHDTNKNISDKMSTSSSPTICQDVASSTAMQTENNNVTSTDNSQFTIPAAIAEIAAREIQQLELTTASILNLGAKDIHTLPVTVTPKLPSSGLGLLASQYDSSSSENENSSPSSDDESDSEESVREVPLNPDVSGPYRTGVIEINSESDSESDSPDSDIEFISQTKELEKIIDVDMNEDDEEITGSKSRGPMRVKGEMLLEDLPPIQDLHITVPETECVELGKIHSIVDQLVLVDSIPGTAALNLDTVLFLDKGQKVLGEVFDVLGQVTSPLYCVRFNSCKQIKERGVEVGQTVYIAPRTEHTYFVILKDMMKLRGSDASWENDIEPSEKHLDYSDDEEERNARRALRNRDRGGEETDPSKRQRPAQSPSPSPSPSPHHHQYPSNRFSPRAHYQRPRPRYRSEGPPGGDFNQGFNYPNYNPRPYLPTQFPPPFAYGPTNASWHANFNQPPPQHPANTYPYPFNPHYQRMPFVPPPDAMQQSLFPPPPPPPQ